jgi:alpha-1,3-glucan synthase
MRIPGAAWSLLSLASLTLASPYRDELVEYNINTNQNAQSPLDYQTSRSNTTYTPSPNNWRAIPFYTILLDKFADGDPSNNDYFGTMFEYDWRETQLRAGGDLKGLVSKLDYLYGMGIRGIFISGTPFINMLWQADSKCLSLDLSHFLCIKSVLGYSPLDFSVLDPHWGTLDDWRRTIDTIHAHDMYIMVDFTVGTMGDLVGFDGYVQINFVLRRAINAFQIFEFFGDIRPQ